MNTPLIGRSLIVLEPDSFVAGYIRSALVASGAVVYDSAQSPEQCAALLDEIAIDAAVLSLDDPAYNPLSLAKLFQQRHIPMMFVSATTTGLSQHRQEAPLLQKPFASFQVVERIVALLAAQAPIAAAGCQL